MTNYKKTVFQPANRGTVSSALESRKSLTIVAPQSPRPPEMLAGVTLAAGAENLTSADLALHDLLITKAYETDRSMSATSYVIPMSECLKFLWTDARKDDVSASLRGMETVCLSFSGDEGRSFRDVQMLTSWTAITGTDVAVGYQFPDPIRDLMRSMPSYGYIELAAIGQGAMRSKYSQMLYKRLAHEVSQRPWKDGAENAFVLEFTPAELADLVGFSAPVKSLFSKLQERVISKFASDFLGVCKFDLRVTYDGRCAPARGQGKTTSLIQLHVKIHPDSHHTVRSDTRPLQAQGYRIGKPDIPRYRINSVFWLSVAKKFKALGLVHFTAHWAWLVALDEALEAAPLSPEYDKRRYRGKALLGAIDANGVEAAAWCFFAEEAELGTDICNSTHVTKRLSQAERSRVGRLADRKRKAKPAGGIKEPKAVKPKSEVAVDTRPEPAFDTCTHVDIEIDPAASPAELDDYVYAFFDKVRWNGTRTIVLRAYFYHQGMRDHYQFAISPEDEEELLRALRHDRIEKWIDGHPMYLNENEKKAA